jgi:hypothetical protein
MARAETLARARELARPDLAYLVPVRGEDGLHDLAVTRAELERDAVWTAERLRAHGLAPGQNALLTCSGYEGFWARLVIEAFRTLRTPYGIAEAMGWDHRRTSVFLRSLRPRAVVGLSAETVEALAASVDLAEAFASTPVVLARPDAAESLRRAGIPAAVISPLGPALAVECPERCGAHVSAAQWRVAERDGKLTVASQPARADRLPETVLPVRGRVVNGLCGCGSSDPRVFFG